MFMKGNSGNMKYWDELSEKEQLLQYISDEHKRAYGVRPRGQYDHLSVEELEVELKRVNAYANEVYEREQALEEESADEFEALVKTIQHSGADTRETALRWLVSATPGNNWDLEHFVWQHGFLFTDRGRALVKELKEIYT